MDRADADVVRAGGGIDLLAAVRRAPDEQARERYPDGYEQPLPYMRIVPAP